MNNLFLYVNTNHVRSDPSITPGIIWYVLLSALSDLARMAEQRVGIIKKSLVSDNIENNRQKQPANNVDPSSINGGFYTSASFVVQ